MERGRDSAEEMVIMPLGGGQEVGRSCILLQYQGRNIMLDCGCHPGREGSDGLPFFDSLDNPEDIDLVLITHFHIDHCAALPYFTEKTNFKGRIFMTHASKAVMKLLLSDNIRLQHRSAPLYSEEDLQNCIDKVEVMDYHETVEYKGIKFSATAAGHVLGAAMFMIDIDSTRILYTGDYSLEEDRHLFGAQIPPGGPPDVMIVESTFGTSDLPSRTNREEAFTTAVQSVVSRGGSCLIPVFALGRAQELLLILDQYWQQNSYLQSVPILYASKLATKSLRVYQTFINMMNTHVRDLMDQFNNPFKLKHIKSIHNNSDFAMLGPCVVMASPGFMQSGVSRQLFEEWCDDPRHGVIIAGYTIDGTLANDLLSAPTEIKCLDNRIKPLRCQVEHISFSAHVDYTQNKSFIKSVMPDYIILVHGEKTQMKRLKEGLESDMRKNLWPTAHKPSVAMPENGVRVKLRFRKTVLADVVGSAATTLLDQLENNSNINQNDNALALMENENSRYLTTVPDHSLLVTENFNSKLVAASELGNFTSCKFGRIKERLTVPIPQGLEMMVGPSSSASDSAAKVVDLLMCHLEEVFDDLCLTPGDSESCDNKGGNGSSGQSSQIIVQSLVTLCLGYGDADGAVTLTPNGTTTQTQHALKKPTHVLVEWTGSPVSDTVADCVAGLIMQAFSAFNSLRRSMSGTGVGANKRSSRHNSKNKKQKIEDSSQRDLVGNVKSEHGVIEEKSAENNVENTEIVESMIQGKVDPSKKITLKHEVSKEKLKALQALVQSGDQARSFSEVKLNAAGDKMIFRSVPGVIYEIEEDGSCVVAARSARADGVGMITEDAPLEAFVFVQFSDATGAGMSADTSASSAEGGDSLHHAVVQCEDDGFRKFVMQALKLA